MQRYGLKHKVSGGILILGNCYSPEEAFQAYKDFFGDSWELENAEAVEVD